MFRPDWSDEKNAEYYGKCSNPLWHGHNYNLFVTVRGEVNPETGYVVNLSDVSKIIKSKIIEKLDHRNINLEVDFMQNKVVSSENLAIGIWNELLIDIQLLGVDLHCIKIEETENNFVEYYG